jgi:glycosyltransferase involved in cell wall biosynthesis
VSVPAVSVLMPVRNGVPWVREAVTSVLTQTAGDLELIVIDDGSTDDTPEVLAAFRDPRLRIEQRSSAGITRALVRALELARAPLVARLDADDVALPDRLERQRRFLDNRPEVGLL